MVIIRAIIIMTTMMALISDVADLSKKEERDGNDYMVIVYFVLVIAYMIVR